MNTMKPFAFEARFRNKPNVLLVVGDPNILEKDTELASKFFGEIVLADKESPSASFAGRTVYLCGDLSNYPRKFDLSQAERVFVVRELSCGFDYEPSATWPVIGAGQVPLNYCGVAVFYREFFPTDSKVFQRISSAHAFHSLTESSKPGTAYRTGTYLTKVEKDSEGSLHYKLLRCSTNMSGPTDNFKAIDTEIVDALNHEADFVFENQTELNHVLAQIYHNQHGSGTQKQNKAKIKMHADKTKDMPGNGIMAFTTDYDNLDQLGAPTGPFRFEYKGVTKLTELKFKLKPTVERRPACTFEKQFSVPLSPGSVVFIPLCTNRWYTHEIKPSSLGTSMVPTRLGYVVRCSKTEAVYDTDGKTYIKEGDGRKKLEPPTVKALQDLRRLYFEENVSDAFIDYGSKYFSMNRGDYKMPGFRTEEEEKKVDQK